jgi:hypothetical protein
MRLRLPFLFTLLMALAGAAGAESITLRLVAMPDDTQRYYVALLEEALRADGHTLHVNYVESAPQPRLWNMVANSKLSLIWGVQTRVRDKAYASVSNELTNGLIGQRILLVPKGEEQAYAGVRTLDDLRRLGKVGGVGASWFDAEVWRFNSLPVYAKTGDWRHLFAMVASGNRHVDYLVRGANEVVGEAKHHNELAIEPHLVLIHGRDVHFYLSPDALRYKAVIERALANADRSGLKKELIARYFLPGFKALNLDQRVRIKLRTPAW